MTGSLLVLAAAIAGATEPIRCEVGMHVVGMSQINIAERAADADLYWWTRCPKGAPAEAMGLTLMNVTEMDIGELVHEDIGEVSYQSQRIRARLKVPLSLKKYPFDHQRIVIDLEAPWSRRDLLYALDPEDAPLKQSPRCCLDAAVNLPDWTIESATAILDAHAYGTSFGYPGTGDTKSFERLRVEIVAHREVLPYIIKYLLPLLIILAMAYARCFWGPISSTRRRPWCPPRCWRWSPFTSRTPPGCRRSATWSEAICSSSTPSWCWSRCWRCW